MEHKLHMPLLFLTLSFIVGVVLSQFLSVDLWVSLAIFLVGGAIFLFRGWSVGLLMLSLSMGGVRSYMAGDLDLQRYETSVVRTNENSLFARIEGEAHSRIERLELSPRGEALLMAMTLGDRSQIGRDKRREYGLSGASHILAVSGMHLSIIFLFVNWILLPLVLLPRGHLIRGVLVVVLVWLYAGVVGFSPSIVRGAAMFTTLYGAFVLGRPYSGVNALLLALLGGAIVVPSILYSVGFQLSAVSIAAIFIWAQPLYYRVFAGGGVVVMTLLIGGVCSVATMPIVSHIFGYIPIFGVLITPLFMLTSFVIVCVGVVWILLPIGFLSPILWLAVESVAMVQDSVVGWVASKWWAAIDFRVSSFEVVLIYMIYIIITILVFSFRDSYVDKGGK